MALHTAYLPKRPLSESIYLVDFTTLNNTIEHRRMFYKGAQLLFGTESLTITKPPTYVEEGGDR